MRVKPVLVALAEPDWALDTDALRAAITERTRAIIVNTPANPSGKVFTRAELEVIADAAREHDLFVFTDEIYEYFVYDGTKHICLATLDGMRERTIVMSGFSKTFSVTGWRLGYVTADAKWMGAMGYFHDLTYVCAPSALAAWRCGRAGAVAAGVLHAACGGPSVETRADCRRAARCRNGAERSRRRLLRAGARRAVCQAKHRR